MLIVVRIAAVVTDVAVGAWELTPAGMEGFFAVVELEVGDIVVGVVIVGEVGMRGILSERTVYVLDIKLVTKGLWLPARPHTSRHWALGEVGLHSLMWHMIYIKSEFLDASESTLRR